MFNGLFRQKVVFQLECLTLEKVDTNVNKNGERIQKKKEGEN